MIENKKLIQRKAEHISAEIYDLLELVQEADSHEEQTVLQVIDELGFEEDINDIAQKFDNLAERLETIEVIDGYQVWIDEYKSLNIIINNNHKILPTGLDFLIDELIAVVETNQQAKNIFKWYIDTEY